MQSSRFSSPVRTSCCQTLAFSFISAAGLNKLCFCQTILDWWTRRQMSFPKRRDGSARSEFCMNSCHFFILAWNPGLFPLVKILQKQPKLQAHRGQRLVPNVLDDRTHLLTVLCSVKKSCHGRRTKHRLTNRVVGETAYWVFDPRHESRVLAL